MTRHYKYRARARRSESISFWLFILIIAIICFLPKQCKAADKCVISCQKIELYGKPVTQCWYDELKQCDSRQPVCVDSKNVYCKPRVVSLGEWNNVVYNEPSSNYRYSSVKAMEAAHSR